MRILWLKTEFLHPLDKGGRLRTYHLLRALHRRHHVTYLTLDDGMAAPDAAARSAEYAAAARAIAFRPATRGTAAFTLGALANVASSLPYALSRYHVPAFRAALRELATPDRTDVVVADFLAIAVNLPARLPVPVVLFQHNVEAEIWRRHAEVARHPVAAAYFSAQWRRMARFEARTCRQVEHVVAVSELDATHFRERCGAPSVSIVETGVDTEYFQPDPATPRSPATIVFVGSMDWMPNEEGVLFFAAEVLPMLRARRPDIRLQVVGRRPTARLRQLAVEHDGIEVTGDVADVRPYLRAASLTVVPLRVGGGTRLKIYEAMAMDCPVVSTTIGAEGLPIAPGEHYLRADGPVELAEACLALIADPVGARDMAERAATHVRSNYAWASVADAFTSACETAVARHASLLTSPGTS